MRSPRVHVMAAVVAVGAAVFAAPAEAEDSAPAASEARPEPAPSRPAPSAPGAYYGRREPFERDGFFFGVALGSSTFLVRDIALGGVGPHVSVRLGTPLSERMLLLFQADFINAELSEENAEDKDRVNFVTTTVGVQWYWRNTIWLKGGIGAAQVSRRRDVDMSVERYFGVGSVLSLGLDLVRRKQLVVDVELVANQGASGDGVVTGSGLALCGTWY